METGIINAGTQLASNFGLGVFLSVAMAIFMGWVLTYVLKENSKREERLADLIKTDLMAVKRSIEDHEKSSSASLLRIEEANRRGREEHSRITRILDNIYERLTGNHGAQHSEKS